MNMTAFRLALGASVLVLTAGAALSDGTPASVTQLASNGGNCLSAPAQASSLLFNASTTARHTNVIRVRYTAAHAMPAKRPTATVAVASCSVSGKSGTTDLD